MEGTSTELASWPALITIVFLAAIDHTACPAAMSTELGRVTLFDAERRELLNTWGGTWAAGNTRGVSV